MGSLKVWDGTTWQPVGGNGPDAFVDPNPPPGTPTMGDLWFDTDESGATGTSLPLTVADGGTGATNTAAARTNLGVNLPLGLVDGGTGGTTAATARTSLAVPAVGQSGSTAGAPTAGTWARGDQWLDSNNVMWVCIAGGTPGTWSWLATLGTTWTTYTPTWTCSIGNPAIGSGGSLTGRYSRTGKACSVSVFLSVGTTGFSGGTGDFRFSLPFPAAQSTTMMGVAQANTTGGSYVGVLSTIGAVGTTTMAILTNVNSANTTTGWMRNADNTAGVGTGVPTIAGQYTLGSGSGIGMFGTYEVQ